MRLLRPTRANLPPVLLDHRLYGPCSALVVFLGYVVINGTAANFIAPRVLGNGLIISPLSVFVSVFIRDRLLGVIGAMLAIPLTTIITAILESFSTTRWMARLMRYAPDSEKEGDAEAVDRAKGIWSRLGMRSPTPALETLPTKDGCTNERGRARQ